MARNELSQALYWVMVAVVLGVYIWVVKNPDLWFFILAIVLAVLGIGYSTVITGESSFMTADKILGKPSLKDLDDRIKRIEETIARLSRDIEEIKRLLEE